MKKLFIIIMFSCVFNICKADSNDGEKDFLAHAGTAYAFNTALYGVMHKGLGCSQEDSIFFSAVTTTILSTTQEYLHAFSLQREPDFKDILKYSIGTSLSIGTVLVFDF